MGSESSQFARELTSALDAYGESLETVAFKLRDQGYPVPAHALENWKRGYFLPQSEAAGEVVTALERLLGTFEGTLVEALVRDLATGASFVPGENVSAPEANTPMSLDESRELMFREADQVTDWHAELVRETIEDFIVLSADRRHVSATTVIEARVPAAPNPTISLPVVFEPNDVPSMNRLIYNIEGANLEGQKVYRMEDGSVNVTSRLALPDDVSPGELHRVAYTCDYVHSQPTNRATERFFAWKLRFYRCRVQFLGKPPENIEYVFAPALGDGKVGEEQAIVLEPHGGVVEILRRNPAQGIGYLYWE